MSSGNGYEPVSFRGFGGGLNLRDKEDAVDETECIDALNVAFTTRGAVKQRDGYARFTTSALTNRAASLEPYYTSSGTKQVLAGCDTRLEAISTAGAVVASATGLSSGTWDFARFGSPGNQVAYAGNGSSLLRKWDGSSWSSVSNTPKGGSLAVMAVDQGNRLVAGRFTGTTGGPTGGANTSNPSRVYFSNAGDPETWATNNYIDFSPGDGESVQNVTAWREFVFVFKESKFFVVYGTTTDATGNPVFNYRTIDGGVGVASPRAVAILPDGVYFMSRRGVYRTTGSEAELISSPIDPIFLGGPSAFYNGGVLNHAQITQCAMGAHEQRIYLGFPSGTSSTNDRVLVYDTVGDWWSLYDLPAAAITSFRISDQAELVFAYAAGSNDLGRSSSSYVTDAQGPELITNGDFETNVTGWTGGTGTTISRNTSFHAVGSASMKALGDGTQSTVNVATTASTSVTASQTYTATLRAMKLVSVGASYTGVLYIEERDAGDAVIGTTATAFQVGEALAGPGNFNQATVSRAFSSSGVNVRVGFYAFDASGEFYVDDVHLYTSTAVTSRWQSGWFDYDLTTEKTIRESKLWGSGSVFLSVATDFDLQTGTQDQINFSSADEVDWNTSSWNSSQWGGSAAGLTEKLRRRAVRGTVFSTRFDNSSTGQQFAVHRLAHHLREQRIASVSQT